MNNKVLGPFIAEVFGTFILLLLGLGVCAQVGLAPRTGAESYSWLLINIGWCFAVAIAVYVTAGVSGAHLNPAVTIAMAFRKALPWGMVLPYIIAQVIGAFLGAAVVYLAYRDGLVAAGLPNIYTTGPGAVFDAMAWGSSSAGAARHMIGPYPLSTCVINEILGTAVLLWGVIASGDTRNTAIGANLGPVLVGATVLVVGTSLGGVSGYAINPARDFGPRIFGLISGTQGLFDGIYWLVAPIIAPIIGGILGVLTYDWFITPFLPEGK